MFHARAIDLVTDTPENENFLTFANSDTQTAPVIYDIQHMTNVI